MNSDASTLWSQNLHDGNMVPPTTTEEDFTNYLDLDLDFSSFDNVQSDQGQVDTDMEGYNMELDQQASMMGNGTQVNYNQQHQPMHPQHQQMQSQGPTQHQMYQQPRRYQRPRAIIPPTPSSNELQGGVASYYHPVSGQVMYDHYPSKDDQISFTPLVSPAVTPADAAFHMPDYAIPGEYFSPLTSPALEAQNSHYRAYQGPHGPDTGATTSPADHTMETGVSAPTTPAATKPRRKQSLPNKGASRSVRQSPIVKAQTRRKHQSAVNLDPATIAELADSQNNANANNKPPTTGGKGTGSGSSEPDSVSPEALAETLMPPPAMPHSAQRSPALAGQSKSPYILGNEPATPATLMRLQKGHVSQSPQATGSRPPTDGNVGDVMEDIMLPEPAAATRPTLTPIKTAGAGIDQSTPKLSAQGSKGRTDSGSAVVSASSTPIALTPQTSKEILSPDGSDPKRTKGTGRMAKKRQNVSSSQVSPAIRPKISPNIKPLMPSGGTSGISADHSALYLASKSNYQNILEGTHLPGVTYPEALAENLSSKRTSHKIAEQGRRNRINTALKEIESLLPPTPTLLADTKAEISGSPEGETSEKAGSANQTTSKASTVEMAIIYIKSLQAELHDTKTKLDVAEKKLAENNSSSSQASD